MGPEQYYGYQPEQQYSYPDDPRARRKRIILGAGGLLLILSIFGIILLAILAGPNLRPELVAIAAYTNETGRVAELAIESGEGRRNTENLAATINTVSKTHFYKLDKWAGQFSEGAFTKSERASKKVDSTDSALDEAAANNNYDETFLEAMRNLLSATNASITKSYSNFDYATNLQSTFNEMTESNNTLIEAIDLALDD